MISQSNSLPIRVKDVAKVSVGYVPRLGVAGKDADDDIVFGIVVMGRTYQTSDVLPALNAEVSKMNGDGSLPPGVKIVPFYNRGALVSSYDAHRNAQSRLWVHFDFSNPMDIFG